jgi:limonene-1,2-epoxide hydrolase|tara:strand:+ start:323 stop:691 length:369 start_codon:yes stop_codon:yes gene_type:complete
MTNKNIVDNFFAHWSRGELDCVMALCTEDVIWDNVPMKPVRGRAAISAFLEQFSKGMTNIHYEMKGMLENGDSLMLEGIENYTKNGKNVSVRYMASFKFREGKISSWTDYFDLSTVSRQLAQ